MDPGDVRDVPGRGLLVGLTDLLLLTKPVPSPRPSVRGPLSPAQPGLATALGVPDPPADADEKGWHATSGLCALGSTRCSTWSTRLPFPKNRRLDDIAFKRLTEQREAQRTAE